MKAIEKYGPDLIRNPERVGCNFVPGMAKMNTGKYVKYSDHKQSLKEIKEAVVKVLNSLKLSINGCTEYPQGCNKCPWRKKICKTKRIEKLFEGVE